MFGSGEDLILMMRRGIEPTRIEGYNTASSTIYNNYRGTYLRRVRGALTEAARAR